MQASKQRPFQDRPRRKKPARAPADSGAPYPPADPRPKGRQPRNNRRDEPDTYYPRNAHSDGVFIYRQDLLQKGFEVYSANRNLPKFLDLAERFPECFNPTKRKVVIDTADPILDDPSFSQSRIQMRDDLREDLGHLIDNEEIPDWFLDGPTPQQAAPPTFDFGHMASRTLQVNKEIAKRIEANPVTLHPRPQELEEINFEELDNKLEANYIKSKVLAASDDEDEVFDLDLDRDSDEPPRDHPRYPALGPAEPVSMNESSDCFNDLEDHIKKMLFNERQSGSEGGEDSEESFNESLGFDSNRDAKVQKMIDPATRNQPGPLVNPVLLPSAPGPAKHPVPLIQDLQAAIRPVESYLIPPNVMSVNRALCNSLNTSLTEPDAQLKEAIENDETLKLTPAEKAARQEQFMDKYGYLDPIMNQLCYEILNSKRRAVMNSYSANGFNQKSVEKYCANKYKIFSLFLQGNIVEKVWYYKDKLGMIHGPFMSYDMDVWNGENNYFSDDLLISLDNSPFINIKLWVNRSSVVMKLVDEFMRRKDEPKAQGLQPLSRAHTTGAQPAGGNNFLPQGQGRPAPPSQPPRPPKDLLQTVGDNSKYDKKVSFHKKGDNDQLQAPGVHPTSVPAPQPSTSQPRHKQPEELQRNYAELFPQLEETDKADPKAPERSKKGPQGRTGEVHLLEALKAGPGKGEEAGAGRRNDKGPSGKPSEPAPVLVAPKKDDKPSAPTKKEPEQEAQADPKKKGRTEPERPEKPEPKKPSQATQGSTRQTKKGGNQTVQRKEDTHIYVAKEVGPEPAKKPPATQGPSTKQPAKPEESKVNQEGTASIKNLLGLSW